MNGPNLDRGPFALPNSRQVTRPDIFSPHMLAAPAPIFRKGPGKVCALLCIATRADARTGHAV